MDGTRAHPPRPLRAVVAGLGVTAAEAGALLLLAVGAAALSGVLWWSSRPVPVDGTARPGDAPTLASEQPTAGLTVTDGEIVVHVAGAVSAPGLYRLPGGARLADALDAAGGPLPDAVLDHLNLARPLQDGEQVRVLTPDEAVAAAAGGPAGPGTAPAGGAWLPDGRLDLNRATQTELEELPGVGPVLAQRIVAHRDGQGGFRQIGELRDVRGIGERTFQAMADLVAVP